jgi:hypothetical protein
MRSALLALLVLLPLVAAVPIPLYDCSAPGSHLKITNASADYWPPVSGQALNLTVAAELDEDLSDGQYSLQVSISGFPIVNQQGDIKALLSNLTWPIPAGEYNRSVSLNVPAGLPSLDLIVNVSATDQNGDPLTCLGLELLIQPGESAASGAPSIINLPSLARGHGAHADSKHGWKKSLRHHRREHSLLPAIQAFLPTLKAFAEELLAATVGN